MKKRISIVMILASIAITTQAQTKKDWYIIGGNISNLGLNFQKGNTAFNLNITPRVAWFIQDDFALGAEALIGLQTAKGFTTVTYGIGPIARYYLKDRAVSSIRKTRWFVDGNLGIYGSNTKVTGRDGTSTNGLGIGLGPGLAYFLNENIALEALAKYNITAGFGNATSNNAVSFGLGFQIHLPKAKLRAISNDVK